MKIYTKTGDNGETALFGGGRVSKDQIRIEAYGTVDELNALIGTARAFNENDEIDSLLGEVQDTLFVLGADLATPTGIPNVSVKRISAADAAALENHIDELEERLEPLRSFVLPGGSKSAALLHQARTVCRRAERRVVTLRKSEKISEDTLVYLNRLSDYLFMLARYANKAGNVPEIPWRTRPEPDSRR